MTLFGFTGHKKLGLAPAHDRNHEPNLAWPCTIAR